MELKELDNGCSTRSRRAGSSIMRAAHGISEELIELRRDFHMHPELGFDVHRTAGIVADALEGMGYRVRRGVGKTGVVADIGSGPTIVALRADMDALPILERIRLIMFRRPQAGCMLVTTLTLPWLWDGDVDF
jgi:metal-dependent amidase/aminoacylase/carboxypeptidase family protein